MPAWACCPGARSAAAGCPASTSATSARPARPGSVTTRTAAWRPTTGAAPTGPGASSTRCRRSPRTGASPWPKSRSPGSPTGPASPRPSWGPGRSASSRPTCAPPGGTRPRPRPPRWTPPATRIPSTIRTASWAWISAIAVFPGVDPIVSLSDFPRYPLTFGPSPVHPLERLSAHLGGPAIWAKREDCNSGLAFGDSSLRTLEYLVPDVLAQGADTLVSIGGVQSNHTRQVAAVAARLGLKARLVQESWVDWPDSVNDRVGNILLSRIMGADVRLVDEGFGIGIKSSWEQALDDVRAAGGKPYAIPAGASDHRLGGLGFANWAQEVQQQEQQLGLFFDTIIVCSVTGSTQAGMI